jgi:uncharacterized protein (TIGR01244 family)
MYRIVTISMAACLAVLPRAGRAQHLTGPHPDATITFPVQLDADAEGFQAALSRVGSDIYIGGQPTADALRHMHDRGVTTVVNLRTPAEMAKVGFDEMALVRSLGMKYVYLPVRGTPDMPFSPATVEAFSRAVHQADGAVLLHCTVAWRASHLWAAYLIKDRGMPVDSALDQGRAINLMDAHHSGTGRQPVEDFLNRDLEGLKRYRGQ